MAELLKIFKIFTTEQKYKIMFIFITMVLGAALEALGIGFIFPLMTIMGDENFLLAHKEIAELIAFIGIRKHGEFVLFIILVGVFFFCSKGLFLCWQAQKQIFFVLETQICYAEGLFAEYLGKEYLFHQDNNSAFLLRNINSGISTSFSLFLTPVLQIMTEICSLIVILVLIIMIDPVSAGGLIFLLALLMGGISRYTKNILAKYGEVQNKNSGEMNKIVNHGLGAIKETKISCRENFFLDMYKVVYANYAGAYGKYHVIIKWQRNAIEAIVISLLFLFILLKIIMGERLSEIIPFVAMLGMALFKMLPSVVTIINSVSTIRFSMPVFDSLYCDLNNVRKNIDKKIRFYTPLERLRFFNEISVENVSFRYPDTEYDILKNVNVQIPKGGFVGVVGPSGSGKTTFVNILLGLYSPRVGRVLVDGVNIYSNIRAWYKCIAYVPQDVFLIDDTIKANVAFGMRNSEIKDCRVNEVLEMAELKNFVDCLPNGANTMVGEHGVKLSGGQRQRLGIARALYFFPEVLVLDEATAALDSNTEKEIMRTILKMKKKVTIIAIAHRINTLEGCDFKIECKDGRVEIIDNERR